MTIRANQFGNQAHIMQQLQAAKLRVENAKKGIENGESLPLKTALKNNTDNPENIKMMDALSHKAAMNLNLSKAQNDVNTYERMINKFKSSPHKQNQKNEELKGNPVYEKLPDNIKNRPDVAQLVNSLPEEALLDPDAAVKSLIDQSLMGNKAAYQKLNEYSKTPFDQLQESASKGMETVVNSADGKPKVLEMVASVPTDKAGEAAA